MKNMSVIRKFGLLVGLIFLMVCVGTVIVATGSSHLKETARGLAEKELIILNKAHELKFSVVQVQQWLTDISATRGLDGLDDGFDEAAEHAQNFRALISDLKELDAGNERRYQEMSRIFEDYYRVGRQMADAYIAQGPAGGNKMMGQFDGVAGAMAEQINGYLEGILRRVEQSTKGHVQNIDTASAVVMAGFFTLLVLVVLAYFILSRPVRQLPVVVEELQSIASGDLSRVTKSYDSQDEVGQLFLALEKMKAQLRQLITAIAEASGQVNGEARQINAVIDHSSDALNTQAQRVNQVATAITEMSSSVTEVAQGASNTADEISNVESEMLRGQKSIDLVADAIHKLSNEVDDAAHVVRDLNDKSDDIGGILDVIRSIAEQTNLLALNAAIEAARAGEQGRGFAVVADEVRTLAQRTQQSIANIQKMIEELQGGATKAVQVISKGKSHAAGTVTQVEQAKDNLHAVSLAVSRIADMSRQIAAATEEQSAVSNEMNENVLDIKNASEEQSDGMEQLAGSSRHLCQMAEHLQKNMASFKV